MQAEAVDVGAHGLAHCGLARHRATQGQHLLPGAGPEGDAIGDGNLVRPLVISGVSRIPFLLVLFGVLGGLAAFGLIGLFVGPVILAILLALWREWAAHGEAQPTRPQG